MVGDWATRRHVPPTSRRVVAVTEEKSHAWRCVTHWLSACRSGDDEPNGGVVGRNGEVAGKVHWRVFSALQKSNGGGGFWSFLG